MAPKTASKAAKKSAQQNRASAVKRVSEKDAESKLDQQDAAMATVPNTPNVDLILTGGEIPAGQRGAHLWPAQPDAGSAIPAKARAAAESSGSTELQITDSVVRQLHDDHANGRPVDDADATEEQKALASHLIGATSSLSGVNLVTASQAIADSRIDPADHLLALEALPVGTILEHEAPYRWRVKPAPGQAQRWGHGATAIEAIQQAILGPTPLDPAVGTPLEQDAGNVTLAGYSEQTRKEIQERDNAFAQRGATMAAARTDLLNAAKGEPAEDSATDAEDDDEETEDEESPTPKAAAKKTGKK